MRQSVSFKETTQLQLQISTLQQEIQILTQENQSLKQQLVTLQKQITIIKQSEDGLQQKVIEYEKLLQEQTMQTQKFQQLLIQVQKTPNQQQQLILQLVEEKDKLLDEFKEKNWIYKKTINSYESMMGQVKILYSEKKEKRPVILGLMEGLMSQQYQIKNWKQNPKIKYEIQEFEIMEIKIGKHMNKILDKKLFFLAHEGLQIDSIGKIIGQISLEPNVEGDLQVGYIIEIQNADDESLKSKFLLRRELKQGKLSQGYLKKTEAVQQSLNNMICQALFERFTKRQESQGYEEFNIFRIQRQFVLKSLKTNYFYYCEMIEEGEFQKFNGGNMEPIINLDLEDFINFFIFDSFQDINEELVVSHLQRVGYYFHDMIVSTLIGVFSQYDQGKQEVMQTIKNLEKALGFASMTLH
ncbi:unnamed protein product [Paramecium sonneborni]|uniref:Alpha-type protein kinase domain-containing protein n=1 Tax=Paramecium sonneborni TaxID=65129 RepID=A0A8S1MJT6_9CILI|nr:unnamed protein product [Paramecium sonneborni]